MSCKIYTIVPSGSDCLLKLQTGSTIVSINLHGATVRPINSAGDFNIQGLNAGALVSSASGFTVADIESRIALCHAGAGGGGAAAIPFRINHGRQILTSTWTSPANLKSLSYEVMAIANSGSPPTIATDSGISALTLNETGTVGVADDINFMNTITFTLAAGDSVLVLYTF